MRWQLPLIWALSLQTEISLTTEVPKKRESSFDTEHDLTSPKSPAKQLIWLMFEHANASIEFRAIQFSSVKSVRLIWIVVLNSKTTPFVRLTRLVGLLWVAWKATSKIPRNGTLLLDILRNSLRSLLKPVPARFVGWTMFFVKELPQKNKL